MFVSVKVGFKLPKYYYTYIHIKVNKNITDFYQVVSYLLKLIFSFNVKKLIIKKNIKFNYTKLQKKKN